MTNPLPNPVTSKKDSLPHLAWDDRYRISDLEGVLTPALVVYPEFVAANIATTIQLLGGEAHRWRPHIKTAKLATTLRALLEQGVDSFKCATTLELLVACESGANDVLVAYPLISANARRVRELADDFPQVRISALVEHESQIQQWHGSRVGLFVDINPGMDRTGIEQDHATEVVQIIGSISRAGLQFRGLHYYDGHLGNPEMPERMRAAHSGYGRLLQIVTEIERQGFNVPEVITSGTPTLPCSLSYEKFKAARFTHRVSPGTVVYCDATSLTQLPSHYGYHPAVLVVTRVVSHPRAGIITCDAGHKSVSADAGVPTCVVLGHSELTPLGPSEEHLPMALATGSERPQIGEIFYLVPRHVCPTVNNFDEALLVRSGEIESVGEVTARGHEAPLVLSLQARSA